MQYYSTQHTILQKFSGLWLFLRRWAAHPLSMGSLIPSSVGLRNLVKNHIKCMDDEVVVEFGGGTGAITRAILESGIPAQRIYSVELDPQLAEYLQKTFPQIQVICGDARLIDTFLGEDKSGKVGTLIVGIPMVLLPLQLQQDIVEAIFRVLRKGRGFLLFTYCITSPLPMKKLGLTGRRLGWTPLNVPPASLWYYERRKTDE